MKLNPLFALAAVAALGFAACEKKDATITEKAEDAKDAAATKIDKAADASKEDAVKAIDATKDAAKDATDKAVEAVKDAKPADAPKQP